MYFIDVQGTLISDADKSPINGARELIKWLNSTQKPYIVVTNNTKLKSDDFLANLRGLGLEIKNGAYIDPFSVLDRILPPCKIAAFGAGEFKQTMLNLGYEFSQNAPRAVLIASGVDFEFSQFAQMIELILGGARLICMHETSIYKKNGRLYPGVGAISAMITAATGANALIVGKPSAEFYAQALNLLKKQDESAEFSRVMIISDDARGDLVGAKELGMRTALVLSGKISDAKNCGVKAGVIDEIHADVGEILKSLNEKN